MGEKVASKFTEKYGETEGQRRKRFLAFLRELPKPDGHFDEKLKKWIPSFERSGEIGEDGRRS